MVGLPVVRAVRRYFRDQYRRDHRAAARARLIGCRDSSAVSGVRAGEESAGGEQRRRGTMHLRREPAFTNQSPPPRAPIHRRGAPADRATTRAGPSPRLHRARAEFDFGKTALLDISQNAGDRVPPFAGEQFGQDNLRVSRLSLRHACSAATAADTARARTSMCCAGKSSGIFFRSTIAAVAGAPRPVLRVRSRLFPNCRNTQCDIDPAIEAQDRRCQFAPRDIVRDGRGLHTEPGG